MSFPDIAADLRARIPALRGRLLARVGAARGVALELAHEHRRARQRRERSLAHEAPAVRRLHHAHRVARPRRQAHELQRLVRGDPAADTQEDARHT